MSHVLTHPLWGSPTLPESHSGPFRPQKIFPHDENESPPTGLGNLGYAPLGASSESSSRLQSMIFSPDLIRRSVAVYPTIGLRDFPGDWSFTSINHFGY